MGSPAACGVCLPDRAVVGGAGAELSEPADHPGRAIRAGGLSDVPARVLAAIMQEKMDASIVVENKTGASGVVGATSVWRAEPDGYTLLINALADVQNLHYIKVPYDPITEFSLIGKITDGPP